MVTKIRTLKFVPGQAGKSALSVLDVPENDSTAAWEKLVQKAD